mgnify:CR=1 FL=1
MKYGVHEVIEEHDGLLFLGEKGKEAAVRLLNGETYNDLGLNPVQAGIIMAIVALSAKCQGGKDNLAAECGREIEKLEPDIRAWEILKNGEIITDG